MIAWRIHQCARVENLKPVVELLDRADEAEVALLDQVEQRQPAAVVPLGDAHHEAQVGLDHGALGEHVARLDALGQGDLLRGRQERDTADLRKVGAHRVARVVGGARVEVGGGRHGVDRVACRAGRARRFDDVDAEVGKHDKQVLGLAAAEVRLAHHSGDLRALEVLLLASLRDQTDDLVVHRLGKVARPGCVSITHAHESTRIRPASPTKEARGEGATARQSGAGEPQVRGDSQSRSSAAV